MGGDSILPARLDAEGTAAAAGALDVRVIELETRTFDRLDVMAVDVAEGHLAQLVDQRLQVVIFIDSVAVFVHGVFEGHVVAEARTASAHNRDAQARRRRGLLRQDLSHLRNRYRGQLNHSVIPPQNRPSKQARISSTVYQIQRKARWLQRKGEIKCVKVNILRS